MKVRRSSGGLEVERDQSPKGTRRVREAQDKVKGSTGVEWASNSKSNIKSKGI